MSCEDRISELHDDLLLKILSEIPTKDVVTTMVLSKRWRFVWTKVPKLEYKDTREEGNSRVWWLIEKSLQHHKAHVLERLRIQVDLHSNDAILRKRVSYSLDHYVRELALCLPLYRTQILYLPRNVYTSKTLVKLTLAGNRFVVDVPSLPCLPSLQTLVLQDVVYKDENSHVRLLATCPALSCLEVFRDVGDNVTRFIVKVPSLKSFTYSKLNISDSRTTSLVLDSPGLRYLDLFDPFRDHGSIQNMPHLEMAYVHYPNDKILRSFSSRILHLSLGDVACCSTISFPRLIKFELNTFGSNSSECSLGLLMIFLHNSPILKELTITSDVGIRKPSKVLPFLCNQQSSVPGCLLSHLETFVWGDFEGRRHERDFVAYILANSKCLKTATVSLGENERMVVDLKSMYRVSATSQLKIHFVGLYSTNPGRATT